MDAGGLFGALLSVYFLLLGGFAAITTAQTLEVGDGDQLPGRVMASVTKTTAFLGFPGLLAVLWFLNHEAGPGQGSGIMSKDMGLFVLFLFFGAILFGLWLGAFVLGLIGAALAKRQRPMVGAAIVFGVIMFAPGFMALSAAASAAQQRVLRR